MIYIPDSGRRIAVICNTNRVQRRLHAGPSDVGEVCKRTNEVNDTTVYTAVMSENHYWYCSVDISRYIA